MPDIFSKEKRSDVMSRIRSKNTKPEIALRKLVSSTVYPLGYRYRIHYKKLPGSPDIVFISGKVAIFVDGTFWHGYAFKKGNSKLTQEFWILKIKANIERDKRVNAALRKEGWKIIRIWEHELKKDPGKCVDRILKVLVK